MERLLDNLPSGPLVITGEGRFFSAGLELPELVQMDRPTLEAFVSRFERVMFRIFQLSNPLVAAINGHAIAGGCVLALQCDARIGARGTWRIGLNETSLGLGVPAVVFETMRCQVPASSVLPIAVEGRLFDPEAARAVGLIDTLVEPEDLLDKAIARARELGAVPPLAFAQTKAAARRPACDAIRQNIAAEGQKWMEIWYSDAAQARVQAAVDRLAAGKQ
jgi:enoyl-CoA hydratase